MVAEPRFNAARAHRSAEGIRPASARATDSEVTNPFVGGGSPSHAEARPPLHDRAVQQMRERFPPPRLALDIGCGTGLWTRPLVSFAGRVDGVDPSGDMLTAARGDRSISFVAGETEHLPFLDRSFDFATVASAIHWLLAEGIAEMHRVLSPGSPLIVYDVWFPAEIVGVDMSPLLWPD